MTFEGIQKPKQVFEILSSHGQFSNTGIQGISFIEEKPKLVPGSNSITFKGKDPIKKQYYSLYQVSSSNLNNNINKGINYVSPKKIFISC